MCLSCFINKFRCFIFPASIFSTTLSRTRILNFIHGIFFLLKSFPFLFCVKVLFPVKSKLDWMTLLLWVLITETCKCSRLLAISHWCSCKYLLCTLQSLAGSTWIYVQLCDTWKGNRLLISWLFEQNELWNVDSCDIVFICISDSKEEQYLLAGVATTNGEVPSPDDPSASKVFQLDGPEWVELFVREMMSSSNIDDARARASRTLEILEKSICARASAEAAQSFHQVGYCLGCFIWTVLGGL